MNSRLLLAHEVQIQLVPSLGRRPRAATSTCWPRSLETRTDLLYLFGRDVFADDVERLDRLDIPARRRGENVAAPLVVGDGQGLVLGGRPADVDLKAGRAAAPGITVGVEDLFGSLSFGWLTVIRPSAHAAWRAAVSGSDRRTDEVGGTISGSVHSRARLT